MNTFSSLLKLFVVSMSLSLLSCAAIIPLLKKRKVGQEILSYVTEHKKKSGTPTMGGLAFLPAACLSALLLVRGKDRLFFVTLTIGAAFCLVGFLDDFLKVRRHENGGLTPAQKLFFQLAVSVIASLYAVKSGYTLLYFPFSSFSLDLGWGMFPLAVFVFLATVNCVNLTDGLDGLASSSCLSFFLCFALLLVKQGEFSTLSPVCVALSGALLSFLLFNTNRANVFMGDTGSLSLGGFAAAIGIFTGNLLFVALIGFVFVVSGVSVIAQVLFFKWKKRRILPMAPAHHTFQKMGFSEAKISYAYGFITLFLGSLALLFPLSA